MIICFNKIKTGEVETLDKIKIIDNKIKTLEGNKNLNDIVKVRTQKRKLVQLKANLMNLKRVIGEDNLFTKDNMSSFKYAKDNMDTHFQIPQRILERKTEPVKKLKAAAFVLSTEKHNEIMAKSQSVLKNLSLIF